MALKHLPGDLDAPGAVVGDRRGESRVERSGSRSNLKGGTDIVCVERPVDHRGVHLIRDTRRNVVLVVAGMSWFLS